MKFRTVAFLKVSLGLTIFLKLLGSNRIVFFKGNFEVMDQGCPTISHSRAAIEEKF